MIAFDELFHVEDLGRIDHDSLLNLQQLHYRLNFLRKLTDFQWIISRGYSTPEEQTKIYEAKGQPPKMGSCHLLGAAADVVDSEGKLKRWVLDHLEAVELMDLYMEDFAATGGMGGGWIHFQIYPPLSQKRFFVP